MNRRDKRPGNRREKYGYRNRRVPPPTTRSTIAIALVIVECTEGWATRARSTDPSIILFPNKPCESCMIVFDAMTKQAAELWTDAPLVKDSKLCGDCDKEHTFWHLEEDMPATLFVSKDECSYWFVIRENKLRLVIPPNTCDKCRAIAQSIGIVQLAVTRSPIHHVHH